jgi:OmpA-OmpF porin, OOP family
MRQTSLLAGISLLALAAGYALPASAQTTRETTTTTERYYMPYEKNFWNNFGINAGSSKYDRNCSGSCDDKGTGGKVYAGGKFRDWLGLELSYIDAGKATFNGARDHSQGFNASAVLGLPLGDSGSSIFAKGGATYGRTVIGGAHVTGWEPSVGLGAAIAMNRNWQIRVDWDRLRFKVPDGKDNVNMVSAGVQYRY